MGTTFLFLMAVLAHVSVGQSTGTCVDVLGHCSVVKANCMSPQAEKQMKKLCAKTCGFCSDGTNGKKKKDVQLFTLEIFLLYIKNDIKFLKEEISDVKARLRELTVSSTKRSKPQVPATLEFDAEVISELRTKTQRLSARLQDQTQRFARLASNFSEDLNEVKETFQGDIIRITTDLVSLSDELKQDAAKLEILSLNVTAQIYDVKENINEISERTSDDVKAFVNDLRNLSSSIADRFNQLQAQFSTVLNGERAKVSVLQVVLGNVTEGLQEEKEKGEKLEAFLEELSQIKFSAIMEESGERVDKLEAKLESVIALLQAESQRTASLEKRLEEISRNPPPTRKGSGEEEEEEEEEDDIPVSRGVAKLTAQVNFALGRLDLQLRKTAELEIRIINNTRTESQQPDKNINEDARREIIELSRKLEQLSGAMRTEGTRTTKALAISFRRLAQKLSAQQGQIFRQLALQQQKLIQQQQVRLNSSAPIPPPFPGAPGAPDDSATSASFAAQKNATNQQQISSTMKQFANKLSMKVFNLEKLVNFGVGKVKTLDNRVAVVEANCTKEVYTIKRTIEEMARLRNNDSLTSREITNKYQQGIQSLLGPQIGNSTRFFSPRFDWENGRLAIFGYIAVMHEGLWGTVCDDGFDYKDAQVICRMAGYQGGVYDNGKYKTSDGEIDGKRRADMKIWIDELRCDGDELDLSDCRTGSEGWGIHDCDRGEDVGIKCFIA